MIKRCIHELSRFITVFCFLNVFVHISFKKGIALKLFCPLMNFTEFQRKMRKTFKSIDIKLYNIKTDNSENVEEN